MKPVTTGQQLVSFPLSTIVADLLRGYDCVPISQTTAEVLLLVSGNKAICHVQMPGDEELNIFGMPIDEPKLWSIGAWQGSCEKWRRARAISDRERDQRFIFEANIQRVTRAVLKMAAIDPNAARCIAFGMVKEGKFDVIRAIGVKKLVERVEEI